MFHKSLGSYKEKADRVERLGGLPKRLVWDREGCLHAGLGRPADAYAAVLGELGVGVVFCRERDPQAKGTAVRIGDI